MHFIAYNCIRMLMYEAAEEYGVCVNGQSVPEINRKDIRQLVIANYRIIYRVESKVVSILTVRHSRQILPDEDITNAWE